MKKDDIRGHPRRAEEGSRLVVVHAGSKYGFVSGVCLTTEGSQVVYRDQNKSTFSEKH